MAWLCFDNDRMEQQIHELLGLRATRRRKALQVDATRYRDQVAGPTCSSIEPKRLQCMTSRPGFLRLQQKNPSLTPLKRLHVELQLLMLDDAPAQNQDAASVETQPSALERCLAALSQDRLCFDVTYTSCTRAADTKGTLFDGRDEQRLKVTEAVAFSSTRDCFTARVIVFTVGEEEELRTKSSLHPPDRTASLPWSRGAKTAIDLLWSL